MCHAFYLKKSRRLLMTAGLLVATSIGSAQLIDFESLQAPATGNPGLLLGNQLIDRGVTFNFPVVLDYSTNPGLTHSGTKALELCYGKEFCGAELEMVFNTVQSHVKIWAGFNNTLQEAQTVVMTGYAETGQELTSSAIVLPANPDAITPIQHPVEINSTTTGIKKVIVRVRATNLLTANLLLDDLEFSDPGTVPPCNTTVPPGFDLTAPRDGQIFLENVFNLLGTVNVSDPFAQIELTTTGVNGVSKKFGPAPVTSGDWRVNGLTSFLLNGENRLRVRVTTCAGNTEFTRTIFYRPDIISTTIHVIDENGADVPQAEVYGDQLLGVTNFQGRLVVTPALGDSVLLSARKMVYQKGNGMKWLHRMYKTSMMVDNNGNVTKKQFLLAPDPGVEQELQVLPSNALIGFHLWCSVEWDASEAELRDIRDHFDGASRFLYNATDGQFLFEQVDISDDAVNFDERIDYRIYGNQDYHANSERRWDFAEAEIQPYVIGMARPPSVGVATNFSGINTYIHEFGHFKFRVRDEYKDDSGDPAACTAKLPPFNAGIPTASCLMEWQWTQFKFCSKRPENPHLHGTVQGDTDCWSQIVSRWDDENNPPRWILKTPVTRGAIVGGINGGALPQKEWTPKYVTNNKKRPNLCQPINFSPRDANGNPMPLEDVWLKTTYGHDIMQGRTGSAGADIPCTGIHLGDQLGDITISAAQCIPAEPTAVLPLLRSLNQRADTTRANNLLAPVLVTIEPGKIAGQFIISVRPDEKPLKKNSSVLPLVQLVAGTSGKKLRIPMKLSADGKVYTGLASGISGLQEGKLIVSYAGEKNHARSVHPFEIATAPAGEPIELLSADGRVQVEIRSKSLTERSYVSISTSVIPPPEANENYRLLIPVTHIAITGKRVLQQPALLTFSPGEQFFKSDSSDRRTDRFMLFQYDENLKKWNIIKHTVLEAGEITARTTTLGHFALGIKRSE